MRTPPTRRTRRAVFFIRPSQFWRFWRRHLDRCVPMSSHRASTPPNAASALGSAEGPAPGQSPRSGATPVADSTMGARRLGPIVAGSLITGLVAAIVLVAIPFAGTAENVITATGLFGFALGWALLALLSVRWTGQPQRWAAVPAALLAVAGAGLLLWPNAVRYDAFAWAWPAVLLALVIWMTVRARQDLRSPTRRWLLYPIFALLGLAAVAGGYENARELLDRRRYTMPGRLVDVGGRRLHVNCTGAGSPTVVLLPGFGETSSMWGWIAPAVARGAQVCVYDRAGRAWSESEPGPQDGDALAADLHALLQRAGEAGPYVLVGHSLGGLGVLTFASRYPEQVAGVVLLDATHPEMFTRVPTYPAFYETYRRILALFPSLARVGIGRVAYRSSFDNLPAQARAEERAMWSTARLARSQRDEWVAVPRVMRQARSLTTLGNRPLIVVTAGRDAQAGWMPLQLDLVSLSSNSAHRVLPNAAHMSLTDDASDAAASSQAIADVVAAVRDGQPLANHE